MYGSIFCSVTRKPRPSSREPMDAAASPLPSEDTTPPVTKMYLVVTSRLLSRCEPFFHETAFLGQRAEVSVQPAPPQHAERFPHARTPRHAQGQQVRAAQPRAHRPPGREVPLDAPPRPRPAAEPRRERGGLRRDREDLVDLARPD